MTRNIFFGAAAAAAVIAFAAPAVHANEWLAASQAYVEGNGENATVAYAGQRPAGVTLPGSVVTGNGSNVSVALPTPPAPSTRNFIAVVEGSGENQTVRHIPAPRG
ncbi:hypothetical protein [Roseomonas sp. CECT 9278]|uniref:hypothetical protein n=1 Tax=Roseomonas sp. CECT 9278 TaxID=2845823 RepID=UPI001E50667E|nr:hypothetical protein [Roseomonas sp. CECT 9278]CAH0279121.1 hypothetical protein ROS9278_03889 [Roseomonas sp. CECT 9278]